MLTIYWILGLLSGGYLISSAFGVLDLDGDFNLDMDLDSDADSPEGPSVFSFRVMMGAIMGFCIGGASMLYNEQGLGMQVLVGALVAIFFAVLAFYLAKVLWGLQGSSNTTVETVLGKKGKIIIQTGKSGTAYVKIQTGSGPREYTCVPTDKRIKFKVGEDVMVKEMIGNELIVSRL